ncbi:MAG: hypothetical protein WC838_05355 [Candidatus Margulisiibacteriota bacterium]|jgi:hypothetical protein
MKQPLKIINPLLFLTVLVQLVTVLWLKIGGYNKLQGEIHEWGGFAFFFLAACHVFFNREWIKAQMFGSKQK